MLFRYFADVFAESENSNDQVTLSLLSAIFRAIVLYAETELLQLLLNEDNYMITFSILECKERTTGRQAASM